MTHVIVRALSVPPRRVRTFIQEFISTETSSGIVLIVCTVLALIWANSPLYGFYTALWNAHLIVGITDIFVLDESLLHWINDALMAIFFLVVGLEIKREILMGELSSVRRAALPAAAALGGMIAPALIYLLVLRGGEGSHGWGVPMATDIAFTLGVLTLLGSRAPISLKIFLTGLAIVDDLGAVLVIAFFYSGGLNWAALAAAGGIMLILIWMNIAMVKRPTPYLLAGVLLWVAIFASGLHATLAGVLLALTIPARVRVNTAEFLERARDALKDFEEAGPPGENVWLNGEQRQRAVLEIDEASERIESPLHRIEHGLHFWVSYLILPLFALANAGVRVVDGDLVQGLLSPVAIGIIGGLVIGKPLGITALSWLAVKLGWAELPQGVNWRHIFGGSILAGIGFTMSIFISTLAFTTPERLADAKVAIIVASLIAGIMGSILLRSLPAIQETAEASPAHSH